ncbi:hypothetical protein [Salibaculum griseiflavum]|jgi:hypothetical protein|uniref:Uncharacterized protein n=1 Tax=Salibaculum griseiflavum TaxID=1914409 RepID=A0A2V1P748_9RHOB|nr:hypothetical protein [Salibaculum griseiflavum]PWG17654.1 hypothetical protein DFK10_05380 [Salibaculum griseiflavum]
MTTQKTPDLIKLYIKSCAIGFAAAAVFVGMLLAFDVVGLWGLVSGSSAGILAVIMMWIFNGIVFAGVQFGIKIMSMAEDDDDDRGGKHIPVHLAEPIPVRHADQRG